MTGPCPRIVTIREYDRVKTEEGHRSRTLNSSAGLHTCNESSSRKSPVTECERCIPTTVLDSYWQWHLRQSSPLPHITTSLRQTNVGRIRACMHDYMATGLYACGVCVCVCMCVDTATRSAFRSHIDQSWTQRERRLAR